MTLVVSGLAVYRLTRLVVTDRIAEPIREFLFRQVEAGGRDMGGEPPNRVAVFAAELVTCSWCTSVWVALGWAGLTVAAPAVAAPAGAVLAWSAASGLLSSLE